MVWNDRYIVEENDRKDESKARRTLLRIIEKYKDYKKSFAEQVQFDQEMFNLSKKIGILYIFLKHLP